MLNDTCAISVAIVVCLRDVCEEPGEEDRKRTFEGRHACADDAEIGLNYGPHAAVDRLPRNVSVGDGDVDGAYAKT